MERERESSPVQPVSDEAVVGQMAQSDLVREALSALSHGHGAQHLSHHDES